MAWTKEQFIEFCQRAGVNPSDALKEGKVDVRSPEMLEKMRQWRVKGALKANKSKKRREAKERKDAIGNFAKEVQNPIGKSDSTVALEQEIRQQNSKLDPPLRSYRVKVTGLRVRPIDPDNFCAGCKGLVDGIVESRIIPRDDWETTTIECAQLRVKTWDDECTLIEIELPDIP